MKIRRLYIGDFGIIRNQLLSDIGGGLVVIGGSNRAGKTSFMQVLRYLGYGFPKGVSLPPATHDYYVEATVDFGKERWDLQLQGYGKPKLSRTDAEDVALEPYGRVDMFTYHQLFTISLDELRLLPEGIDEKEESRLQSVLLGAGLSDIARIPQLVKELDDAAYKIGASMGRPNVAQFKPRHLAIKEAVRERDKALARMDEYRAKIEKLSGIHAELQEKTAALDKLKEEIIRLEILLHNHDDYVKWVRLVSILAEPGARALLTQYPAGLLEKARYLQDTYHEALDSYGERLSAFSQEIYGKVGQDADPSIWQRNLLLRGNEIEFALRNLSGVGAKIEAYEAKSLALETEKRRLEWDIDALNRNLKIEDLDDIRRSVKKDQLERAIHNHGLLVKAVGLGQELMQTTAIDFAQQFRSYAKVAVLTIIVGAIIGIIQPFIGIGLAAAGVVGVGLYLVHRTLADGETRAEARNLKGQLLDIGRQAGLVFDDRDPDGYLGAVQERLVEAKAELEEYRILLGLDETASLESYGKRLEAIEKLSARAHDLSRQAKELARDLDELSPIVSELYHLVARLGYGRESLEIDTHSFGKLSIQVENIWSHLQLARELEGAKGRLEGVEEEISAIIDGDDYVQEVAATADDVYDPVRWLEQIILAGEKHARYKATASECETLEHRIVHSLGRRDMAALKALGHEPSSYPAPDGIGEDPWLSLLVSLYEDYGAAADLEEALRAATERMSALDEGIRDLEASRDILQREINDLNADETLVNAQRAIDRARSELEPLAFEYSTNRVASLLLETLQKQVIEEIKGDLLDQASRVLRDMTDGEYQRIMPLDEIDKAGFQLTGAGGERWLPEALSRGTTEQLFLAVRLGRIREIDPPLPVILDDCLVNFDPQHAYQAMQGINKLSKRNQIFVLTCHPELVEMIGELNNGDVQYWQLDRGIFSVTNLKKLREFLSHNMR